MKQFYGLISRVLLYSMVLMLVGMTTMSAIAGEKLHTVSGHVALKSDGSPIVATVEFATVDERGLFDPDEPHCIGPGISAPDGRERYSVSTDKNGDYEIQLPEGQSFMTRAMSNLAPAEAVLPSYYPGSINPMDAAVITITEDRKGIDFALDRMPMYNNGFSGVVLGADGNGKAASMYAQLVSDNAAQYGLNMRVRFAISDFTTGNFTMSNLVPGEYVIQVVPGPPGTLPQYYNANGKTVLNWENATRIKVGATVMPGIGTMQLVETMGTHGTSKLQGVVTGGKNSDRPDLPLHAAWVLAIDANNHISDYAMTDAYGKYTLNKIGAGTYSIVIDKIGYVRQISTVQFDKDGDHSTVDVSMGQQLPTDVADPVGSPVPTDVIAYPNPAAAAVTIRFSGRAGTAHISIANLLGMEMFSTQMQTVEGVNLQTLSTERLAPGMYFVSINGKNIPLTISR